MRIKGSPKLRISNKSDVATYPTPITPRTADGFNTCKKCSGECLVTRMLPNPLSASAAVTPSTIRPQNEDARVCIRTLGKSTTTVCALRFSFASPTLLLVTPLSCKKYPSWVAIFTMRSRVSSLTPDCPDKAFDTAYFDTPARSAICCIVTFFVIQVAPSVPYQHLLA